MNITIQKTKVRRKRAYCVVQPLPPVTINGKTKYPVHRTYFKTEPEAKNEKKRLEEQVANTGQVWLELPGQEKNRIIQALRLAEQNGMDILAVLEGHTVEVRSYSPKLKDVRDKLVETLKNGNRSLRYLDGLKTVLDQFIKGREEQAIDKVTAEDVERHLNSKNVESRSTIRARLSRLFNFAKAKKWMRDNPCSELVSVKIEKPKPRIFSPEELDRALAFLSRPQAVTKTVTRKNKGGRGCNEGKRSVKQETVTYEQTQTVDYRHALPWFILSTGAGLRPEEAEWITRDQINFDEGWVAVEKTKRRQRRVVYPRPEVMAALKWSLEENGGELPINHETRLNACAKVRASLGWTEWYKDVTRHSGASNLLATYHAEDIADALGNSVKILLQDYKALVTRAQAERFWQTWAKLSAQSAIMVVADQKPA